MQGTFHASGRTLIAPSTLGILAALASSLIWGSGDFTGGLAARRSNQYQVLALASLSGSVFLAVCTLLAREAFPTGLNLVWAVAAGLAGSLGVTALYRGLAIGQAAVVAPVAAVVSVILPVVVSAFLEGLPGPLRLIGFAVALAGMWLVSQSAGESGVGGRQILALAAAAGLGFGGFFVFIALVDTGVYAPLLVARLMYLVVTAVLLAWRRVPPPKLMDNPAGLLAGVLDVGGNVFYVFAKQLADLAVAAVLSSLYPAATVLLSWIILKERIFPLQWFGAALCLVAVVLIAL